MVSPLMPPFWQVHRPNTTASVRPSDWQLPRRRTCRIGFNTIERSIQPLTLNRKNALFAGSDDGGDNWAVIASLIETAKLNCVDPQAWLADTLTRLAKGHRINALDDLMSWTYAARVVG